MSEKTDIQRLADRLATTVEGLRLRIGTVTAIETTSGAHDVQLDITDAAWVARAQDVVLNVGDRVWVAQEGPIFVVGGRLSGGLGGTVLVQKMADESRASTIAPANDSELFVDLPIGLWRVELFGFANNADTADGGDVRSCWANTGTMTNGGRTCLGPTAGSGDNTNTAVQFSGRSFTTNIIYGVTDNVLAGFTEDLTVEVAAPGRLTWQWAQGTSLATATIVRTNSRLYVTPLQWP